MLPEDWDPVSNAALRRILSTYRALRTERADVLSPVPEAGFDVAFAGSTRSPARIVQHLLSSDDGALTSIAGKVAEHREIARRVENGEQDGRSAIPLATGIALERLMELSVEERSLNRPAGTTYSYVVTAHRILRRMLEHNWEHLRQIQEYAERP
jgi:hypothetical protein